jgi:hypothetical protein
MKEDMEALKKGQAPAGFQLEKQMEKELGALPTPSPIPATPGPAKPTEIGLGRLERAKPLPGAPGMVAPTPSGPIRPAFVAIPAKGFDPLSSLKRAFSGGIGKTTVIIVGVLVIVAGAIWFFLLRGPSTPVITYTPTPSVTATATPTPTPVPSQPAIENILITSSIDLTTPGNNVFSALEKVADKTTLTAGPELYSVRQTTPAGSSKYSFSKLMLAAGVSIPQNVLSSIDDNNSYLSLALKANKTYGYGFIAKLNNQTGVSSALKSWEKTMPENLKNLFVLDLTKASSTAFLDNIYKDTSIRYTNFPTTDKTVDYGIVTLPTGESYLIVTNSREHIYSIIDKMLAGTTTPTPSPIPSASISPTP